MPSALWVFFNDVRVGRLWLEQDRTYAFQYDPEWLANPDNIPLSISLPLTPNIFIGDVVRFFFANLLPEGELRDRVAHRLGISRQNVHALLRELGGDCAGALSIHPEGTIPVLGQGDYSPLSSAELAEIVTTLPIRPFLAGSEGIRLSLAGAQDKLPVYCHGETISLPRDGAPSTHILKTPIARLEFTVINEAFCMNLARSAGLPTPGCRIMQAGNTPLLLVTRYDRRPGKERILRLHQEDFCQAMGISPEVKYQSEGGPGLRDCAKLLRQCSATPAKDVRLLARWCFANTLLGNADGHAKNLSLLYDQAKAPRLAPFYDIISTRIYDELSPRLAMKIGGENRPEWIMKRHWERMAEELGLKPKILLHDLTAFCKTLETAIVPTLQALEPHGRDAVFLMRLEADIRKRIAATLQIIG